ncbi:hypothetical protein QYF61_019884 [Mycteria americana]|uniref:Uncharacterized protein n=1 Tax=Mycteria americana TaxID=33587 RepID=A0AAN7S9H7_MYCAM|nr:hypothetical protein QYF61_019884 [Mycteria americana]
MICSISFPGTEHSRAQKEVIVLDFRFLYKLQELRVSDDLTSYLPLVRGDPNYRIMDRLERDSISKAKKELQLRLSPWFPQQGLKESPPEKPALLTIAQTESKFRLRVPDAETNPRRDEVGTHVMENSSSCCNECEQRSERKVFSTSPFFSIKVVMKQGETQITATCWGLAHAYQALFNTIQYPQGEEKVSGSDDKVTGTAVTPAPATGTVATPTLVTDTMVTPIPVTGTAAELGNQPMLVSVTPIHKKKSWKQKSAHLGRDGEKAGPSQ